jgi:hypothetical protein
LLTVRFAVAIGVFAGAGGRAIGTRGRASHGGITEATASRRNAGIRHRTIAAAGGTAAGLARAAFCASTGAG